MLPGDINEEECWRTRLQVGVGNRAIWLQVGVGQMAQNGSLGLGSMLNPPLLGRVPWVGLTYDPLEGGDEGGCEAQAFGVELVRHSLRSQATLNAGQHLDGTMHDRLGTPELGLDSYLHAPYPPPCTPELGLDSWAGHARATRRARVINTVLRLYGTGPLW